MFCYCLGLIKCYFDVVLVVCSSVYDMGECLNG